MDVFDSMLPAFVIIVVSGVAGAWVAMTLRSRAPAEPWRDKLEDADEKVSRLMTQLRELKLQESRMQPELYAKELAEHEREAADALRERDGLAERRGTSTVRLEAASAAATPTHNPTLTYLSERPALKGALWGAGAMLVAGLLLFTVSRDHTVRDEGGSVTGGGMGGQVMQEPAAPPPMPILLPGEAPKPGELEGLVMQLKQSPGDVALTVRLSHLLIVARMQNEATLVTNRALQLDPDNLEAVAHAAAIKSLQDPKAGLQLLDAVLAKDAKLAEAWLLRGMIGMRAGDEKAMRVALTRYLELAPSGAARPQVEAMLGGATAATRPN